MSLHETVLANDKDRLELGKPRDSMWLFEATLDRGGLVMRCRGNCLGHAGVLRQIRLPDAICLVPHSSVRLQTKQGEA